MRNSKIIIVGAGVIGLSTGIKLLTNGYNNVTIIAEAFSPNLTSDAAPACFHPYITPSKILFECIQDAWKEFKIVQKEIPTIITNIIFSEYYPEKLPVTGSVPPERIFLENRNHYSEIQESELPKDFVQGFRFETLLIDIPLYMPYLNKQFLDLGGHQVKQKLTSLKVLSDQADVIINCAGYGARQLVDDSNLVAVRGQAHTVAKLPHIKSASLAIIKDSPGYPTHPDYAIIVPRSKDIYIAGTTQLKDLDLNPRKEDEKLIIKNVSKIVPGIAQAKIIKTYVGLRPEIISHNGEHTPRLEIQTDSNHQKIIHNYGHAGAGITASWGSANKVLAMMDTIK